MFRNHLKIGIRSLWRNRQFSIINLAGLSLGIAVFLLIAQYVAFEWGANRFHKNYDKLYRVNLQQKEGATTYLLPPGLAPLIKQKITGVEDEVRVADGIGNGIISLPRTEHKSFREDNMLYVDGGFLQVFTFPLLAGSPKLDEPKTLALSETMSAKLFGSDNAIGKTVIVSNQFGNTNFTVTAVYKDMPAESDIKAAVLLSINTLASAANRDGNDWADPTTIESGFSNIYVQLAKKTSIPNIEKEIEGLLHVADPKSVTDKVILQPFKDLHLAPSFNYPLQTSGSLLLVTVFSCVGILILLIAWVNYINLSTAQALNRAREVGVRKVLGANRSQLITQYLTETLLITVVSALIALLLVGSFQPIYNDFTGKQLSLAVLNVGWFWTGGILLILMGSLLAGGYVALVLSSFQPITIIRGKIETMAGSFSLRKTLVVFQFTISIVLIIATTVLYRQLRYMSNEDLGMNLKELLVIKGPTISGEHQAEQNGAFKNALGQLPFVNKYAASNNIPGQGYNFSTTQIARLNAEKGDQKKAYSMFISDEKFFDTYKIKFKEGTGFTKNDAERSWNNIPKVVINERAVQSLGFKQNENVAGQTIIWEKKPYEIIGVVKDYHHLSLREMIKPTIFLASVSFGYFTIQTNSRNMASKLKTLKKLYNDYFGENPFEYFFADEQYDKQYEAEQKLGTVFIASASVAILIACMGLFGLATFSAHQRTKEIGIRKVLGATVMNITTLLSKDFLILVIVSIIIACPIAWLAMHKWLEDFAYRAAIPWWIFVGAGATAILIALLTIGFEAIKAAVANPVKSLRTE